MYNTFRYIALLGATFFNYAVSVTGVVLLYVYYTHVRLLIMCLYLALKQTLQDIICRICLIFTAKYVYPEQVFHFV